MLKPMSGSASSHVSSAFSFKAERKNQRDYWVERHTGLAKFRDGVLLSGFGDCEVNQNGVTGNRGGYGTALRGITSSSGADLSSKRGLEIVGSLVGMTDCPNLVYK
ncbi:hypothetical protein N9059_00230 [bacterium]|nr:hypothetical protein [bacterium]